ncbi:hypothetical protein AYK59_02985 [Pseudomonas synxantha]|nr:hypothetical protein AYK59_02985 [Pseudomonas synxantha]
MTSAKIKPTEQHEYIHERIENTLIKEVFLAISVNIPTEMQIIKTMFIFPLAIQVEGNLFVHQLISTAIIPLIKPGNNFICVVAPSTPLSKNFQITHQLNPMMND